MPFSEEAQYGIELFYPYDNELHVSTVSLILPAIRIPRSAAKGRVNLLSIMNIATLTKQSFTKRNFAVAILRIIAC